METIAVIQSVYVKDKPEYLKLSLDSIFSQSYQDFKMLLGIDGPITEELRNVISSFKDERGLLKTRRIEV